MDQRKSSFEPLAFSLTVVAALLRLAPHPSNFTPVGSVALFGGARLRGWQAYCVPLLAMLVTDPIRSRAEGSHSAYSWGTLIVYSCFLISVLLGRLFLRNSSNAARIAVVVLAGSLQFYVITNFFVWLGAPLLYPHTWPGLMTCYVAALPFFARTILGDLFYSAALFGIYAVLSRRVAGLRQHQAAA
jgi:uncharacterized membrane protein